MDFPIFFIIGLLFRSTTCKNGLLSSWKSPQQQNKNNNSNKQQINNYIALEFGISEPTEPTLDKSANQQKKTTTNFYFSLKTKKKYCLLASCWFVFGFSDATKFETHIIF